MGRIAPDPSNVLKGLDFAPTFGGLKKGETARILLFEFGPTATGGPLGSWAEWVHSIRVPAVKETRPDGTEIEVQEEVYIGSFICLGDEAELAENLMAPESCPFCARAVNDEGFKPTRRHATNIIRYSTKPNTHELLEPFGVELLVWKFSERQFKALTGHLAEWNDLRQHDLKITCTNGRYQNYDIDVAASAAWLDQAYQHDRYGLPLQQLVVETVKSQKYDDEALQKSLGFRAGNADILEKLQTYDREMAARGRATASTPAATAPPMAAQDINDMLAGTTAAAAPQATDVQPGETAPSPLSVPGPAPAPAAAETAAEPAQPAAAPAPAQPVTTQSVDDLLS